MSESIYFNLYNDNKNPGKFLAYIDCVSNNLGRPAFSMKSEAFAEPFTITVPSKQLSVHREDSIPSVHIKYDVEPDPDMPNLIDTVAHEIFKLPKLDEAMCALRCFAKSIISFLFVPSDPDAVSVIENKELDEYVTLRFQYEHSLLKVSVDSVVRTEDDFVKKNVDRNGIAHFYVKASVMDDYGDMVVFLFTNNHLTSTLGDEGELIPNVMSSELNDVVPVRFEVDADGDFYLKDEDDADKVNKFCMSMIRESHANNNPMMFFSDSSKKAQQLKFILKEISKNSPDVAYELVPENSIKWYGSMNPRWPVIRPKAGIYSVISDFKKSDDEVLFTEVLPNAFIRMLLEEPKHVNTTYADKHEEPDATVGITGYFKIRRFGTTASFIKC